MVYELDQFHDHLLHNNKNNNNVHKFIAHIAENYMETTEGENWASNLISHLNSRYPTGIDTRKGLQTFLKQEVQDTNLHQIVSSHSSLPHLLVSNSFCQPESYMNLGYNVYNNHASVNIYNPISYGGSAYNEYGQNVACGGMNLISPLGVTQTDLDIITSPEQVSSITACSYGDVISDTEAFDSRTPTYSFQPQPFHNSQYTSFTENKRNAYNMDSTLLLADDVQSPYPNSCNMLQNDSLQSNCNTQISHQIQIPVSQQASVQSNDQFDPQHVGLESSRDAFNFHVLNAYVCYKDMPADLRREIPFGDYMHDAECKADVCKCHLYLELSSHFDKCNDLNCDICGPARSGNFRLDSRKRKLEQLEATNNVDPRSTGTLVDALPTKYPKLESSIVAEHAASLNQHEDDDAMVDDPSYSNDSNGEQKLTGPLNQSNDVSLKGRSSDAIIEENDVLNLASDNADESGLQPVTTSGSLVDCDSVLEPKTELNGLNSAPDADGLGLALKKPETPSDSLVNCDSALESKSEINGLNSAPVANELVLTLKKPEMPDGSLVNCDSVLESKTAISGLNPAPDAKELDLTSKQPETPDGSLVNGDSVLESKTVINGLNQAPDAKELDLTSKQPETPDGSLVNGDSVLESKTVINGLNQAPDAKELDLTSKQPETPDGSLVNGDSVLESKTVINGLNPAPDANELDLTSKQPEMTSGSLVNCDSVLLESKNTEIEMASLTDNGSGLEPEKIKIQSVSLADFFTADQIKQHLLSFTSQKDALGNRPPSNGHNTCQVCSMEKLAFAPAPIYCSSCEIRIKRNVGYYRSTNEMGIRHCFCMSCYRGSHGNNILLRGFSIPKAHLQKAKNDEEKEDSWVLCDKCQCWQHRTCGLYNDEKDVEGKAEYICPKCYLEEIESGTRVPLPQATASEAKDLPRTNLSDHIEERLSKRLDQEREEMSKISGMEPSEIPVAEGLVVRVVVSVEKHLEVRQKFIDILHGEDYPSGFSYRSKLIFLFQKIEGVDVCLFGMCVQEFGSECGGPNKRCVYISYLDSVKYFRPERKSVTGESLRTVVYHEILIGYLEYCKNRGFATCYIWACPLIKGEDYIFYCHPETQRTPKQDKLRQWYKLMLKKATEDNVVVDYTNIYNQFFVPSGEANSKITAARLPYFDGDYWSGAAENIVRKLEVEESAGGGLQSKLPNKRILKAMGQDKVDVAMKDVIVMQKLGQTILPVKENFMIVHLQHKCTHCHEVILSGSRWFCSQCKKIQLCSRCFNADKNYSVSKMHTCQSGETNLFSEVAVNNVTLDTTDKDDVFVNSFFETRDAFLNKCQKSHFQFDTLSRAKYSSMMILYHLIYKPPIKPACAACLADVVVEQCWQCDKCAKYYLCEACYKMRLGAYHPHRLYPPSVKLVGGSKSEQLQKQKSLALKVVLDTLMHASQCDVMTCSYKDCITMRRLFCHSKNCSIRVRGGCNYCQRVWRILKEHSQICTDSDCKIPRCMDIKKFKEETRAAHNTNERVALTTNQQATMKDQQEVPEVHIG